MSGLFRCPWCARLHDGRKMFDCGGVHRIRCDACRRPIVVNVRVDMGVEVDVEKCVEAERRMGRAR